MFPPSLPPLCRTSTSSLASSLLQGAVPSSVEDFVERAKVPVERRADVAASMRGEGIEDAEMAAVVLGGVRLTRNDDSLLFLEEMEVWRTDEKNRKQKTEEQTEDNRMAPAAGNDDDVEGRRKSKRLKIDQDNSCEETGGKQEQLLVNGIFGSTDCSYVSVGESVLESSCLVETQKQAEFRLRHKVLNRPNRLSLNLFDNLTNICWEDKICLKKAAQTLIHRAYLEAEENVSRFHCPATVANIATTSNNNTTTVTNTATTTAANTATTATVAANCNTATTNTTCSATTFSTDLSKTGTTDSSTTGDSGVLYGVGVTTTGHSIMTPPTSPSRRSPPTPLRRLLAGGQRLLPTTTPAPGCPSSTSTLSLPSVSLCSRQRLFEVVQLLSPFQRHSISYLQKYASVTWNEQLSGAQAQMWMYEAASNVRARDEGTRRARADKDTKRVECVIHGGLVFDRWVFDKVINTKPFQRMRELCQLGACRHVFPSATHTRFEHSLGVGHLARQLFTQLCSKHRFPMGDQEVRVLGTCLTIAGLCHDLGHGPYRSTEGVWYVLLLILYVSVCFGGGVYVQPYI
eukprot:GHVS01022834.1.p1 GENE.GHVS01022834.1~~GHVS01022834.1.p1  ORF type:complete len:572 (-),score=102.57 GHVS01022834.1:1476-3191(-)